ncbi:MAG: hypothetical protein COW58_05205 [Thalassolituus sp. CG17_big_fil_post_rev_8_21_14_2_50_53_8]|nr:MAG: hypothetical protein COW58_05205 [Thalassolituus sp. CG17_big_fil_post_rev_8_21_14_2_50_53_8]
MRKRIIESDSKVVSASEHHWLDLQEIAEVEITSEDVAHPIESAFVAGSDSCWLAASSGEQTLRLLFDAPQRLTMIRLLFQEEHQQRTQEFALRSSSDGGTTYHDIAHQQYNFNAPDSIRQLEDYAVDLNGVNALELCITPDISGGTARASLAQWAVA